MFSRRLASFVRERGALLSRVLLAGLQVAAIAWFSPGKGLPLDDAWIHQVVARTFAETGTLGYAPGQHGAAATSYLWAALLAVDFRLLHLDPSRWALLLNGAAALATGQLLYSIVARARPDEADDPDWRLTAFVTSLLAAISPNVLWFTCSGMEAMPLVALSLTAIWAVTEREGGVRYALGAGAASGALALMRPEAAPLGAMLCAYVLVRGRRRDILAIAAPWLSCVALYVGSNIAKTGHALPSTLSGRRWLWFEMTSGLSRTDRALDFLDAWATRLGSYTFDTSLALVWVLAALAAYGAFRLVRGHAHVGRDGARLLFLWALFHAAFYALLLPTPGHGGRYQPLTPLLFVTCLPVGVALVLHDLARLFRLQEKVGFTWFAALGVAPWIALGAPVAESLRSANALAVAHIQATELDAGAFVDQLPDGPVASFDIGGIGFVAKRRILDLGGLSDPKTAALLEAGTISTWLASNRVRWVVLPQSYEPTLPVFEDFRSRLHFSGNESLRLEPVRVFETPFDKWEPSIRSTWNAAPKQIVYEVTYTDRPGPREVPLVPGDARRAISDAGRLVPNRERIVAEHMLATLAAWDLPVDVRVTGSPDDHANGEGACTIRLGWWGIGVDGCAAIGPAELVRTKAYEQCGRFIDLGDLGGALRAIPHVVAEAKRRSDPRFHPPLAPLMLPMRGGFAVAPMRAGGLGLALFAAVFVSILAVAGFTRRMAKARTTKLALTAAAVLALTGVGCGRRDNDVGAAIARGRGAVEIAIANGGRVDAKPGSKRSPLGDAAATSDAALVSVLLEHGAHVDARGEGGATALHVAARRGLPSIVAILAAAMTKEGIDLPAGPRRRTALHDATTSASVDSVVALLRAGADPKKADAFGQTALHLAATIDPPRAAAIAEALLEAGAGNDATDARGFTALDSAAVADNVALIRVVVAGGQLDRTTPADETALDLAVRYGKDRAAETLLAAGARPKDDTLPPLHDAARMDAVDRAASLLGLPADTARLANGKTALEVATARGSKRVEALLREPRR